MKTNKKEVYLRKANKIISKYEIIARTKGIYENFGDKDLRKFSDDVYNCEDLMYGEKCDLKNYLSHKLATITQ